VQYDIVTISSKSRNLGYGWTNDVVQDSGHLRVAHENITLMTQGGPATVQKERSDAFRINNNNDWAGALFVGGKRVVAVWGIRSHYKGDDSNYDQLDAWSYSEGWIHPNTGEILKQLYNQEQIVVKIQVE